MEFDVVGAILCHLDHRGSEQGILLDYAKAP